MATKIRYKANGMKRSVADFVARRLVANGVATYVDAPIEAGSPQGYMTRHMEAAPVQAVVVQPPAQHAAIAEEVLTPAVVDIDGMSADELRTLANDRGIKVHHKAGAEKIREALRATEG